MNSIVKKSKSINRIQENSSKTVLIVSHVNGNILYNEPLAEKILNTTGLVGKNFFDLIHPFSRILLSNYF